MRVDQVLALARVHAGRRLVEQEQPGLRRKSPGDLHQALLSVGKAGGRQHGLVLAARPEPGHPWPASRERFSSRLCDGKPRPPDQKPDFSCRWQPTSTFSSTLMFTKMRRFWKVRAMPRRAASAGVELGQLGVPEPDPAAGHLLQPADGVEQGGLAGAVRADEGGDAALLRPRGRPRSRPSGRRSARTRPGPAGAEPPTCVSALLPGQVFAQAARPDAAAGCGHGGGRGRSPAIDSGVGSAICGRTSDISSASAAAAQATAAGSPRASRP